MVYIEKKRFDKAVEFLNKAINLCPTVESYFELARVKIKMKSFNGAIECLNKVIEFNPEHVMAYKLRAECFHEEKKFDKVIIDLNNYFELIKKSDADAYFKRAYAHMNLKDYLNAEKDIELAINMEKNNQEFLALQKEISTKKLAKAFSRRKIVTSKVEKSSEEKIKQLFIEKFEKLWGEKKYNELIVSCTSFINLCEKNKYAICSFAHRLRAEAKIKLGFSLEEIEKDINLEEKGFQEKKEEMLIKILPKIVINEINPNDFMQKFFDLYCKLEGIFLEGNLDEKRYELLNEDKLLWELIVLENNTELEKFEKAKKHLEKTFLNLKKNKHLDALKFIDAFIKDFPAILYPHIKRTEIKLNFEFLEYEIMEVELKVAQALDPFNVFLLLQRARFEIQNNKFAKAKKFIEEAQKAGTAMSPLEKGMSLNCLAEIEYEEGNLEKSLKYIQKAIEIFPDYPLFYKRRALIYLDMNEYQKVKEDIEKIIHVLPTSMCYAALAKAQIELSLLSAKLELKFLEEPLENLNKAIEINPANIIAYNYRSEIFFYQKEYEKAWGDLNISIDLEPNSHNYCNRAIVNNKLGRYKEALQDIEMVLLSSPYREEFLKVKHEILENIYNQKNKLCIKDTEKYLMWKNDTYGKNMKDKVERIMQLKPKV